MKWRLLEESELRSETRSLREIYAERIELIAKYVPAEIQAVHKRAVEELEAVGVAAKALQVAATAPEFELPDQNGRLVNSRRLLERGRLVICFIRGRWCPFCVGQMEAMNVVIPQLKALNASLIAISPQTVHQSFLMADQHHLEVPLLSDSGNKVAGQFGVAYQVPQYQREIYQRVFTNLPFLNGDSSWTLPIPAIYILGRQDTSGESWTIGSSVRYGYANPNYTERPEPSEIVDFLSRPLR